MRNGEPAKHLFAEDKDSICNNNESDTRHQTRLLTRKYLKNWPKNTCCRY